MTLLEILAKIKADDKYDPTADLNKLTETAVMTATEKLVDKNKELLTKLAAAKVITDGIPEGFTPEEWKKLKELEKTVDITKLKGDEAVETLRKQLNETHASAISERDTTITDLTTSLESEMINNAATLAIDAAHGFAALLLPHVKTAMKMVKQDDGTYAVQVIDASGTQRFSIKDGGSYMKPEELVGTFKSDDAFKAAFKPDNGGGGSPPGGPRGGSSENPWAKGTPGYSVTDQATFSNKDPAAAKLLQEAAVPLNAAYAIKQAQPPAV